MIPAIPSINTFQSGISYQVPKCNDISVVMISVPYFDIAEIEVNMEESLTLSQYQRLGIDLSLVGDKWGELKQSVVVHQAWFMVINNSLLTVSVLPPCLVLIQNAS